MRIDTSYGTAEEIKSIPKGKYVAVIDKAEEAVTSTSKPMWKVTFKIVEGEFAGRKIFENFVIDNEHGCKRFCSLIKHSGNQLSENINYLSTHFEGRRIGLIVQKNDDDGYPVLAYGAFFAPDQQSNIPMPAQTNMPQQQSLPAQSLISEDEVPF